MKGNKMAKGNIFLDKEFPQTGPTAKQGAARLVQMTNQLIQTKQVYLENVRKVVAMHGIPALVTELGTDEAAAMQSFYTAVKKLLEETAPNISVANINQ